MSAYRDLPTIIKGVRVHITGYAIGDNGCTLQGYGIDSNGIRIDGSKTLRRSAKTAADVPLAERHLVAAVEHTLPKKTVSVVHSGSHTGSLNLEHPMVRAFQELIDGSYKICETWNDVVEERSISGFRHRLLPRILKYIDMPFTQADQEEILSAIADEVRAHGNSLKNELTVMATARKDMVAYATVYDALRRVDPMLPVLELAPPRRKKTITAEQIKSLPRAVRRAFARKLKGLASAEPLLVLGAVLMWDAGTRTAEAAAVIPSIDIDIVGTVMILKVQWQEKDGKRSAVLKTDAAYRKVPLSAWGRKMVTLCCDHINTWPAATDDAPITANNLQRFVKNLLRECGVDDTFWAAAREAEARNPDRDSKGNPIMDVVAYTLRHDRASIWRNICGLTVAECDYLLGHSDNRAKKRKVDYRLDTEQHRMAVKLENFVADANISSHPALVPIPLAHGDNINVLPYESAIWVNSSDASLAVDLDLIAAEAGEDIDIDVTGGDVEKIITRHISTHGIRDNKPLIGTGQLCEFKEVDN